MINTQYLAEALLKTQSLASPILITDYSDFQLWLHIRINERIFKKIPKAKPYPNTNHIKITGVVSDNILSKKKWLYLLEQS